MTVASNPPFNQYYATTNQTVFNYTFEIVEQTDLLVYQTPAGDPPDDATQLLALNVDYTVTGVGAENGGTIVLNTGATLSDVITIKQNIQVQRDTSFTPGGILRAQDLNVEFDNQTLIQQTSRFNELARMLSYQNSAIVVPLVDTIIPVLGANQIWAKNANNDAIIAYDVPDSSGLAPNDATYLLQTPNANLPNAQAMSALSSGFMINTTATGVILSRILTGTANQLGVLNASGLAGNPSYFIVDNPIMPGTAGMGIPIGTTAQRVIPLTNIGLRYNTDLTLLEYYDSANAQWQQLEESNDVASLIAMLASHTVGEGASMIGLQNQGSVLNKTLQDLANATLIAQTDNGTLANGQFLSALASGMVGVTTTTGVLLSRVATGTANQIDITNGDMQGGNPTWSLPTTLIAPGTVQVGNMLLSGNSLATQNLNGDFDVQLNGSGLFKINTTVGVNAIINDNTMFLAAADNIPTALSVKQYVDSVASGIYFLNAAVCATTANLTATYNNGASGVGATLTNSGAQAVFELDGVSATVFQRVLIKNQSNAYENGVYIVTDVGSVSTDWVLTRASDFDQVGEIVAGAVIPVNLGGVVNGGTSWMNTSTVVTVGTDAINWIQFTASLPISMDNGGTGANLTPANGGIVYSGAGAMAILAPTATANQILKSGANSAPHWSTATYPDTVSANAILFGSSSNVVGEITPAASSVLISSAGSVPSWATTLPSGVQTNITQLGTITAGVWNGTDIAVPDGGSGRGTATAYAVICGGTTSTAAHQSVSGLGTTGQVLTSNGAAALPTWQDAAGGGFASGTRMIFQQTSAPTGWTKDTTAAINNGALRTVTGSVSTGGTVAFTTAFTSITPTGTVGATTLTSAQIPAHTHPSVVNLSGSANVGAGSGSLGTGSTGSNTGGGGSHTHSYTGDAINLAVKYYDVIIAQKD